jgi:hypothetical protein
MLVDIALAASLSDGSFRPLHRYLAVRGQPYCKERAMPAFSLDAVFGVVARALMLLLQLLLILLVLQLLLILLVLVVVFDADVALPGGGVDFVDFDIALTVDSLPNDSFPYRHRDRQRNCCLRPSSPACVWDFGGACVGAATVLMFGVWTEVALVAHVVVAVVRRRRFSDGSISAYFPHHYLPLLMHRGPR